MSVDHKSEAIRFAKIADSVEDTRTWAIIAQSHATLYLAEQQRIANLIAYHAAGMHKGAIDGPGLPGPHEQVRKGLGL